MGTPELDWRRERDSNPRRAFDPYTLSRGAPSTTRPSLRERVPAPPGRGALILKGGGRGKEPPFSHRPATGDSRAVVVPLIIGADDQLVGVVSGCEASALSCLMR